MRKMLTILLPVLFLSFIITFVTTKFLIRKINFITRYLGWDVGFTVPDFARKNKPKIPRFGGLAILAGLTFAVLISVKLVDPSNLIELFATLLMIVIVGLMAFFGDVMKISDTLRTTIPLIAALPLVAISVGVTSVRVPFVGPVDFGIFYSLILVPIGVAACSNLFNMLAGHNGLEAGTGAIVATTILSALYLRNLQTPGVFPLLIPAIFLLALLGACLAFLYFNWYPAKIFPGDTGTYVMGATIAGVAIIGNIELIAIIAVMPQIIEFFLKMRVWFKAENFGELKGDRLYYKGRAYSLTHLVMRKFKPTESQLTSILLAFQALWGLIAIASLYV